jgi:hypothetical protein
MTGETIDKPSQMNEVLRNMSAYQRRVTFGRAFNEYIAGVNNPIEDPETQLNHQEGILIGTILRMRRLGIVPYGFRIDLAESEDSSLLEVTVTRSGRRGFSQILEVQREGRSPELNDMLGKTVKSFRSNGKPRRIIQSPNL